jgi:hypothetical protein
MHKYKMTQKERNIKGLNFGTQPITVSSENIKQNNEKKCNSAQLHWMLMLSVIMLSVVVLSVVSPAGTKRSRHEQLENADIGKFSTSNDQREFFSTDAQFLKL